jgi:hypothetical protein
MLDLSLSYLDSVEWEKFPRSNGVLKVSQVTKDRVWAWIDAQFDDAEDVELMEIVASRCVYGSFTAISAIVYGLSPFQRYRLANLLSRLARFKKIERKGAIGRYAYRLLAEPVKAEKLLNIKRSALESLKSAEVAKRYA